MTEVWMPTRYTPSLTGTEDFVTDGDKLIRVVEKYWREEDVQGQFILDDWQRWLIRHVLERYPDDYPDQELAGRLRWRQVLISMGRQNGKSILGAIFGVYGLLFHEYAPRVVSLGYSEKTAKIVYDRVAYTLNHVPQFKLVVKVTKTSGIRRTDGPGEYIIKCASEKAIQGFPITLCIYDEVHITPEKLWSAAKQGTRTKKDGLIVGITTAGDDQSKLLLSLYASVDKLVETPNSASRLGGFIWEAAEGSTLDDDDAIRSANPAVACGRVTLSTVRSDAHDDSEVDQQRYVLNRFVASVNAWINRSLWEACAGTGVVLGEDAKPVRQSGYVYSIDASQNMEWATITVHKNVDGVIQSSTIREVYQPTPERLLKMCLELRRHGSPTYVLDGYNLRQLGDELTKRGMTTYVLKTDEFMEACKVAYRKISRGEVNARNESELKRQVPRGIRKNVGLSWRIDRAHSSVEVDALLSTIMGIYIAETKKKAEAQVF